MRFAAYFGSIPARTPAADTERRRRNGSARTRGDLEKEALIVRANGEIDIPSTHTYIREREGGRERELKEWEWRASELTDDCIPKVCVCMRRREREI